MSTPDQQTTPCCRGLAPMDECKCAVQTGRQKDGYTLHLEHCLEQTLARCQEAYDRIHGLHGSIAPMRVEIERLRARVADLERQLAYARHCGA